MSDEKAIFVQAIEIAGPQERQAFIDRACGDNAVLRAEVEALLAAHEAAAASFLESPPPGLALADAPTDSALDLAGNTIGHYKLLERVGEGGMGVVYMAEQLRPVKRRVALKIIKPGLDTKQVIARFEAERQALAMMDHPSIAKVFDAGATDTGRPYFVMELVRGVPITEYCDQNQLTPRQRLELFVQVCQAVQHAHQKGIIHRDLKPNNVLVTLGDNDKPVPKVIDFGIAKATGEQRLTDRTLFTEFRQLIGTPLYMSPEQAEMSQLTDVDTRSDVYSLGVLLYELLTGTTPFDKERLAKAAYDEVRRIIREEEPPRPSTRLSTLGGTIATISARRQSDPKKLNQTVRGELDWIVMKALEKERARRYETPNGLARDVERYLVDQPVEACPPSRRYRIRKFARRNKVAIATISLIGAILVASTVVSTEQAVRARRAEADAQRKTRTARAERDKRDTVNQFLNEMLAPTEPKRLAGTKGDIAIDTPATQLLDQAVWKLDRGAMNGRPEIEAPLRRTIGRSYLSLYQFGPAQRQFEIALNLNRSIYSVPDRHVVVALFELSNALLFQNNAKESESRLRDAIAIEKQISGRDDSDPGLLSGLAGALLVQGKLAPAEALYRHALELGRGAGTPNAGIEMSLGYCLEQEGRFAEAEALLRDAMAIDQARMDNPALTQDLLLLAESLKGQQKWEDAEKYFRETIAVDRRLLGGTHRQVLDTTRRLEALLRPLGKTAELQDLWRQTLESDRHELAAASSLEQRARLLSSIVSCLLKLERFHEAGEKAQDLDDAGELNMVAWRLCSSPSLARDNGSLAVSLAEKAATAAPRDVEIWNTLGLARYRIGDYPKAIEALETARQLDGDKGLAFDAFFLAMAHFKLGEKQEARQWYDQAVSRTEQELPADDELLRFRAEAEALIIPRAGAAAPATAPVPATQP